MSSVPPLIFIALLGAAVAAGDEAPRQPVGVSVSLGRATIWQRAPAQDTGLTILGVSCDLEGTLAVFALFGLVDNRTEGEARAWGVANPSLGMTLEMPVARRLDLGTRHQRCRIDRRRSARRGRRGQRRAPGGPEGGGRDPR